MRVFEYTDATAESIGPGGEIASHDLTTTADFDSAVPVTTVTISEVEIMLLYLRKARDRALRIREHAPAGSYLDNVLANTITGIELELSQLRYLLTLPEAQESARPRRMRPAI